MVTRIYTIPTGAPFVDSLAEELWRQVDGDPLELASYLILLPTQRACRHLREALLKRMEGGAALLPRMQTLGDIDEEELYFSHDADFNIPPAITPLRRQLLLTQLVMRKDPHISFDQAAQLATALAQFLDQAQIMRCDMTKLGSLVTTRELAEHWKETVAFLEILTSEWPKILAEEGCIDPADRRCRVLEAQATAWSTNPPLFPVLSAGSTGTQPATADLLVVINSLPRGAIILPGLDSQLDEEAWQAITEQHPQFGMKELLTKLTTDRKDVLIWGKVHDKARGRLLQESQRPADVTGDWQHLRNAKITAATLEGLARVTLDHPQEEAQAIALMMRAALETPHKTAALVTPDRDLAERVSAMLARWGINANDSAGTSLANRPVGGFLLDVLAAASPNAGPVDYLSLLKHPIAACGLNPAACRTQARDIEINVWRSQRSEKSASLDDLRKMFHPIRATWNERRPLMERLAAHIQVAEIIAGSDSELGKDRLWTNDDGEAASNWLDEWRSSSPGFPPITGEDYEGLCAALMRQVKVRATFGQHPRLSILGLLEARLIQSDLMILGGLNEGVWPPEAAIDPWMSRPMRKDFHLPMPEQRVGLAAHDFVQLASAPEVILTRSRRAGSAPAVPSRFILELQTALRAIGFLTDEENDKKDALAPKEPWRLWARLLDEPEGPPVPCTKPEPRPPQNARPKQLSVTEIGTWQRNPYAIYAKHILKLNKLDPLDADADAKDRGMLIHKALDIFVKKYPTTLPQNALDDLRLIGEVLFSDFEEHPEVKAFWWPRFEVIASWFIPYERARRGEGIMPLMSEAKGKIEMEHFTLRGRADRIDRLADGKMSIVDYKSGAAPSKEDVNQGIEPQLPLLALIAERGGFEGLEASPIGEVSYWAFGGREIKRPDSYTKDIPKLIADAGAGLESLIRIFADPSTPYQAVPKPHLRPRDDYAHLARLAEWGRTMEEQ